MINLVVEGMSDREAAKSIVRNVGQTVGKVVVAGGKTRLDPKIPNYNRAAKHSNWVVFRDSDGQCPVELREQLEANVTAWSPNFRLRIAHSMTEAWLLADRNGFADFFGIRLGRMPVDSESVLHGKHEVLRLCSGSRTRTIRQDMVRSTGETGPLYVERLNEFAATKWDVTVAAANSASLKRAIQSLKSLPREV